MNKHLFTLILSAATALSVMPCMAQRVNSTGGNSPHETTSAVIGDRRTGCRVTITYGRPYMKGRNIWGGLVPYGRAWRLGSDEATLLIAQQPLAFGDTTIPAGVHTLYMVPQENGPSKLVFSSKLGGWGIPVDTTHDVASVELKKEKVDAPVEQLTITVASESSGGVIKISWGDEQFSAPFTVKKEG